MSEESVQYHQGTSIGVDGGPLPLAWPKALSEEEQLFAELRRAHLAAVRAIEKYLARKHKG